MKIAMFYILVIFLSHYTIKNYLLDTYICSDCLMHDDHCSILRILWRAISGSVATTSLKLARPICKGMWLARSLTMPAPPTEARSTLALLASSSHWQRFYHGSSQPWRKLEPTVTNTSTLGKQELLEIADLTHSAIEASTCFFFLFLFFFFGFRKMVSPLSTTHWGCFRINVHSTFVSIRTFGKCSSKWVIQYVGLSYPVQLMFLLSLQGSFKDQGSLMMENQE